jgi:porphobilinogen synthase
MFPTHRPRRLRRTPLLRDMVRETLLHPEDLIYPMFVQETSKQPEPINAMPGQMRHTIDSLIAACEKTAESGVKAIILFGIPEKKDEAGTGAYAEDGIVQRAVRAIKEKKIPLCVITDVCMCEYTSHGHCGAIKDGDVANDPSLTLLAKTALSQVKAGADLVAPSDMMDGRVAAIRRALDDEGFQDVAIMAYSAKYASAFYGPFREAAGSAPQFGDRQSYQMDPANVREALKEVQADIEEGADMVMVKPALSYLDVIRAVKELTNVPVAAYNVSGEYAMVEFAAKAGALDRERIIREILTSIRRAGADLILTYHAVEVANWLRGVS